MSNLQLDFEWVDSQGAKVPELRSTWARLRIVIDDEPVTRLFDYRLKSVRDAVFVPLYPFAEWIALHWWNLFFESHTPGRDAQHSYIFRHCIRYAREGYALPDLVITPVGKYLALNWNASVLKNYKLEFIRSGSSHISEFDAREVFSIFIEAVIEKLHQNNIFESLLEQEWMAINSVDSDEQEFCIAAAELGLNPYNLSEEATNALMEVGNLLPRSIFDEFFKAAEFNQVCTQAHTLKLIIENLQSSETNIPQLIEVRRKLRQHNLYDTPWNKGYKYARNLRSELNVEDKIFHNFEDLAEAFCISNEDLSAMVEETDSAKLFDALVVTSQAGSPRFAIDKRRGNSNKFAFCRGLFEFFGSDNNRPLLATKSHTEDQKCNRAFAAEFLAPAYLLKERLGSRFVEPEEVENLAREFGVSSYIIEHQLRNHNLIEAVIMDR